MTIKKVTQKMAQLIDTNYSNELAKDYQKMKLKANLETANEMYNKYFK